MTKIKATLMQEGVEIDYLIVNDSKGKKHCYRIEGCLSYGFPSKLQKMLQVFLDVSPNVEVRLPKTLDMELD